MKSMWFENHDILRNGFYYVMVADVVFLHGVSGVSWFHYW